jgi:transposase
MKRFGWFGRAAARSARVAEDLGVGLSTLVRWISLSRDRQIDHPPAAGEEDTSRS